MSLLLNMLSRLVITFFPRSKRLNFMANGITHHERGKDFPVAQMVKNLPAVQDTWVLFLGWEDSLEKGMEVHSSILAWRIPWMEEPGRLQSMGSLRAGHD